MSSATSTVHLSSNEGSAPAPQGLPVNWGASSAEVERPAPCDALLAKADTRMLRAVTIHADRAHVFRWLCQLRSAPYSYDLIDNWGRRSPRQLTPGLSQLALGQSVMSIFRLVDFAPDVHMTLRCHDRGALAWFGDVVCTYALSGTATPNETRLVVTLLTRYPDNWRGRWMRYFLPWGDLFMMRKQLLTLKQLAERSFSDS